MAQFTVNPERFDPYKNFKFRVKWEGRYVAGITKAGPLRRETQVIEHREGGDPSTSRKSSGLTRFEPIVLERGITHDHEFENWANLVWRLGGAAGAEAALANFRKDVTIELHNEAGQLVIAYNVYRAWPSTFQALPELDANGGAAAIETLVLQHEGWERDVAVQEPVEPKAV